MQRLQSAMHSAARLRRHVAPLLRQLHWLNAPERIEFKLAVLVARTAAMYFADELHRSADSEARRPLRGASSISLIVTGGSIAMKAGGATLQNHHSRLVYSSLTRVPSRHSQPSHMKTSAHQIK